MEKQNKPGNGAGQKLAQTAADDNRRGEPADAVTSVSRRRDLVLVALFAALSGVLAHVQIPLPFTPVPVTGQTLAPMLTGLLLGPRLGAWSQLVYLFIGLAGAPVFAGGTAGPGEFLGPTGGYLLGLVPGAWITGLLAQSYWNRREGRVLRFGVAAALGGVLTIYATGVPWLAYSLNLPFSGAISLGALPFLLGDSLKVIAAAVLAHRLVEALPSLRSA